MANTTAYLVMSVGRNDRMERAMGRRRIKEIMKGVRGKRMEGRVEMVEGGGRKECS